MRRADRLFAIIQALRGGRLRTAHDIALELEVSTRTIWRDIADLQAQGVPIDGERGLGYVLRDSYFIPPLALTPSEMEALVWGTKLVEAYGDEALAAAARVLHDKISSVSRAGQDVTKHWVAAFPSAAARAARHHLAAIRTATKRRKKLAIHYRDLKGMESNRVVRPLNLEFWGQVWTLTAWCESRADFRVFRCDQIIAAEMRDEGFRDEPGRRFADFLTYMRAGDFAGSN